MQWMSVCQLSDILPSSGVAAFVRGEQVAIFRAGDEVYAISNYDPFSSTHVLARGVVGDRHGVLAVASPVYKQAFSLKTGECVDDPAIRLPTYPARVVDGVVQVAVK
jgi:nitrite reductase (NADH) small subunit